MSARTPEFTTLSDQVLRPRLPRIGNVKIGGKGEARTSGGGKTFRLPAKYDHFVVTKRARDAKTENFIRDEAIHQLIGPKPTELDVVLMFNEPEQNFQTSLVAYDGKAVRCQGNGQEAYDRVLGKMIPCTCPLLKQHQGNYPKEIARPVGQLACKPYGVLSVLLVQANTFGGFYVFRTTSWESISSITAALREFKRQLGVLAYLPMKLVMYPATDTYEEGGKIKTSTSYKVGLVLAGGIDTAIQIASGAHNTNAQLLQLSAGNATYTPEQHAEQLREIAGEDQQEVAGEFFPGQAVDAEYEIEEEEEPDPLEELIRRACKIASADLVKTNASIEKWRDREGGLPELAARVQKQLEEHAPAAWQQAKAEIEAEAAAAEQEEQDEEPAGREPGSDDEPLELFS